VSISCPKCSAGKSSLYPRIVTLETGEKVEEIACRICSHVLAARPVVRRAQFSPAAVAAIVAEEEVRVDQRKSERHRERCREAMLQTVAAQSRPCSVSGCAGTYFKNENGLCREHAKMLHRFVAKAAAATKPRRNAPLLLVNGFWIERGQPLPGIQGAQPVVVVAEAPPMARRPVRRKQVKRSMAKPSKASPVEKDLAHRSARHWHAASAALLEKLRA
jgi:hypothetical protein